MKNQTKKYLRKLSEKYDHILEFRKDIMVLKNSMNEIEISPSKKDNLIISYNANYRIAQLEITPEFVFDIVISIFERSSLDAIKENLVLITLDEFYKQEGDRKFWENIFDQAKIAEEEHEIKYQDIGGNRILVEYYKGLLIFRDDLSGFASNVIEWK